MTSATFSFLSFLELGKRYPNLQTMLAEHSSTSQVIRYDHSHGVKFVEWILLHASG